MKKVLIIAYDFPPMGGGGVMRVAKFTKYLKLYDYEPVILTLDKPDYYPIDNELFEEVKEYKIHRVKDKYRSFDSLKTKIKENNNINGHQSIQEVKTDNFKLKLLKMLSRVKNTVEMNTFIPDKSITWADGAVKKALEIIQNENINLVFITSPPHGVQLIGSKLKAKLPSLHLVVDLRDGWTINPLYGTHNMLKMAIEKFQEKKVFELADRIICATPPIERLYRDKYKQLENKFMTITNGFDSEKYPEENSYSPGFNFNILYTGSIGGKGRKAHYFLEACKQLTDENQYFKERVLVKFIGHFLEDKSYWKSILNENIEFVEHVSQSRVIEETCRADLLMLTFLESQGGETVLTGKIFEYMAAKRPILALIPEGEAKSLIKREKIGFCCEPENVKAIKREIINAFELWKGNKLKADIKNEQLANYDRKNLTGMLSRVFDEILN